MKSIKEIKMDLSMALEEIPSNPGINMSDRVNMAIALLQEYGKYSRGEAMSNNGKTNGNGNSDKPISQKQKEYLQDLGVTELPATSREASALIEQIKSKKGRATAPSPFSFK